MDQYFKDIVLKSTGATYMDEGSLIQNLWSNYGEILRYKLEGSEYKSIVIKHVRLPENSSHPRGWNTDISHNRKIKSYIVETQWYKKWSSLCDESCRIPECITLDNKGDEVLIVLEDLNESGYPVRKSSVNMNQVKLCIKWLANFHGTFINKKPEHLWEKGTYWHLQTRPEELKALTDIRLKKSAGLIDKKLDSCPYSTIVHGDAKLANFCFSEDGNSIAVVDFQYTGGGVGVKDLAYFIGSCLYEEDCGNFEDELLECYFTHLKAKIRSVGYDIDLDELETLWRELYPVAWTDFHRFLKGWSPGHWKINGYSERLSQQVMDEL